MFCIKHAALSVYLFCGIVNIIATDLKQIQRRIERERQVEKIKNEIMKNLGNTGLWTNNNDHLPKDDINFGYVQIDKHGPDKSEYDVINRDTTISDKQEPVEPEKSRNPIISIGEPDGDHRNGCLRFSMNRIAKDNSNVSAIIPVRVNLWVYIRKKRSRSTKDKRRTRRLDRSIHGIGKEKRSGNRKRRKQKGRKIKLFITNGQKRLSTMRMRVRRSVWQSIDLPISQFPELIRSKDSFKICLQCKRCNKKVKVDLYRKLKTHKSNRKPTIPFIHIETANNLAPHNIYRHKRSHKNRHHCKQSCCKLETFNIDITKTFPTIVAPVKVPFTYCVNTCETDAFLRNSTVVYDSTENSKVGNGHSVKDHHRQCLPQSYKSFAFLYLRPNSDIMLGSIPNMFAASCRCT